MIAKFEVTVYNREVRKMVEAGERHTRFEDDWADFRYIEVRAPDAKQARTQVERRFPPELGFVIESIEQHGDFE